MFISSEYKDDFYINKENKDNRESVFFLFLLIYISLFLLSVTGERKGCVRGEGDPKGGLIPKCTFFWIFFFLGGGGGREGWASGFALWASDFRYSLAHCLVPKKVSVEHCIVSNISDSA